MKIITLFSLIFYCALQTANAQVSSDEITEPKLKGRIKCVVTYTYRDLIGDPHFDSLRKPKKNIKDFDEKGNQIDEIDYDKEGHLESKLVFEYSKTDTIIKKEYDSHGNLTQEFISIHDFRGNETEIRSYSDGKPPIPRLSFNLKYIYKYDDKNNRIEADFFMRGAIESKHIFVYNPMNQLIEEDVTENDPNGDVNQRKTVFNYDSTGLQIRSETPGRDGKVKFEDVTVYGNIDEHGNWLTATFESKRHSSGNHPRLADFPAKEFTKREIEYYK